MYKQLKLKNKKVIEKYKNFENVLSLFETAKAELFFLFKCSPVLKKALTKAVLEVKANAEENKDRTKIFVQEYTEDTVLEAVQMDILMNILNKSTLASLKPVMNSEDDSRIYCDLLATVKRIQDLAEAAYYIFIKYIIQVATSVYYIERNRAMNTGLSMGSDSTYIISNITLLFYKGFYRFNRGKGSFPTYITLWLKSAERHMPHKELVSLIDTKNSKTTYTRVTGTIFNDSETQSNKTTDEQLMDLNTANNYGFNDSVKISEVEISILRNINKTLVKGNIPMMIFKESLPQ